MAKNKRRLIVLAGGVGIFAMLGTAIATSFWLGGRDNSHSGLLADAVVAGIEEAGGYGVGVSALSDGLLVAVEGAVPIPVDDRMWGGVQDPQLMNLSLELMGIVNANPKNLVGGAFSANDVFLEVYAKDPEGAGIVEIAALVEQREMVGKVVIVPVAYSMADLKEAKDAILSQFGDGLSVNVDMVENKIIAIPNTPALEAELLPAGSKVVIPFGSLVDAATVSQLNDGIAKVPVAIELPTVASAA